MSSDVHKNLKKANASNELAKNTYTTNVQKNKKKLRDSKNKLNAKDTKISDVPTRYGQGNKKNSNVPKVQMNANSKIRQNVKNKSKLSAGKSDVSKKYQKADKGTLEVFKKVQINATNKTECKKRDRKRNMNLVRVNQNTVTNNEKKLGNKKLQIPAKNLDFERKKTKVEKLKKMNEKKMKRISARAQQVTISDEVLKLNKRKIKIKQLEETLTNKSQLKSKATQLTLRDRMMAQLRASRFRFINEILYTNDSSQSKHYFKTDPDSFMAYHTGYKMQLEQWPVNPLDVVVSSIKKLFVYSALSLKEIYANLNSTIVSQL